MHVNIPRRGVLLTVLRVLGLAQDHPAALPNQRVITIARRGLGKIADRTVQARIVASKAIQGGLARGLTVH